MEVQFQQLWILFVILFNVMSNIFLVITGLIREASGSDGRAVSIQYPSIPSVRGPHRLHNHGPKVQGKAESV